MNKPGHSPIRPVMKLRAYALRVSGMRLTALAAVGFVLLALVFAVVRFAVVAQTHTLNDFVSSLATSFEGQALIQSGSPTGRVDRILRFVQALGANLYLAIIIGLITFRMLRRKENIRFPQSLAYNHLLQAFEFRFVNFDASDMANVDIRVFIRKRISRLKDRLVRDMMFPVKLNLDFEPYTESMMVVAFRSEPPQNEGSDLRSDQLNRINLDAVDADSAIVVTVSGTGVKSGDSVVSRKVYWFDDIVVGSYRDTETKLKADAFGDQDSWRQRDYSLFEEIEGVAIPAMEWRTRQGREGLASVQIGDNEHIIHYPTDPKGNTDMHVKNILTGDAYKPLSLLDFAPSTVIDIGANVGVAAAYFLSQTPKCNVHCFEPDTTNYQYLRRNLGNFENVELRPIGLYDADTEMTLLKGSLQCMQHSVFPSAEVGSDGDRVQLKDALTAIRPLIDENTILKIDTEGCELPILTRLKPVLDKFMVIYFEFHSEDDRLLADELLQPSHGLWSSSMKYVHRGDQCYVNRKLWESNADISKWIIASQSNSAPMLKNPSKNTFQRSRE